MKKDIVYIIIAIAIILTIGLTGYYAGYNNGKYHVIEDSQIYMQGTTIYIDIDGNIYTHNPF